MYQPVPAKNSNGITIPSAFRPLKPPHGIAHCFPLRVDQYLSSHFSFLSRSEWKKKIKAGKVLVDGRTIRPSHQLRSTDQLWYYQTEADEPPVNTQYEILYQDEYLLVVFKPSNLPIHPAGKYYRNTLTHLLAKDNIKHDPIHRIDRETSGILVCAKDSAVKESLRRQFKERKVAKEYLAITYGPISSPLFEVNQPIGQIPTQQLRKRMDIIPEGAPSLTLFEVAEQHGRYSLLKVFPKTGRTNQIRLHLEYNQSPIVGDTLYCQVKGSLDYLQAPRLALHAHRITFMHPITKKNLTITSHLPADLEEYWEKVKLI